MEGKYPNPKCDEACYYHCTKGGTQLPECKKETMDKKFINGIIFKKKENAPDFVIGSLSIKVEEFTNSIKEHSKNGWVNLDIKKSQKGTYYVEVNEFQKDKQDNPFG
jgi:hypothetical protein